MNGQVSAKIINLAHRQDRQEECHQEMAALGWHENDSEKKMVDYGA